MKVTLIGFIYFLSEMLVINEAFQKREIVVEIPNEGYDSQFVKYSFNGAKRHILTDFATGQKVEIKGYLKGKKVVKDEKESFFLDLEGYDISVVV